MFLARGFDAASMGDIAKAAGVSKGTLYVYFKDKDELFAAIVGERMHVPGGRRFRVRPRRSRRRGRPAASTARLSSKRFAIRGRIVDCAPSSPSPTACRTSAARSTKPAPPSASPGLSAYLDAQVEAGVLAIDDCEVAAAQFIETCHATMFKPMLFNFAPPPTPERIAHVVGIAVRTFLAAYRSAVSTPAALWSVWDKCCGALWISLWISVVAIAANPTQYPLPNLSNTLFQNIAL